jgi:predicted MPP superfamily phosphohydrolase
MKKLNFLIFFCITLCIYGSINYYIYLRGSQAFFGISGFRISFTIAFILIASAYIIGRIWERLWICPASSWLTHIGAYWLGAMFYFFLIIVGLDLLGGLHHLWPFWPNLFTKGNSQSHTGLAIGAICIVLIILILGRANALHPRLNTLVLTISKPVEGLDSLKIISVSDIHLGSLVGARQLKKMVIAINHRQPDLILFAGDIVDEDLKPVICNNLGAALKDLRAPLGIYGINGNHEYIGGVEHADSYLESHGIRMLKDDVVSIRNQFYLVGREDRDGFRFTGRQRKSLQSLIQGIDQQLPVILLDHQPFRLDKAVQAGIDLQLSGHTHHGQIWPLNYITRAIYEVSWGYLRKGDTHIYVSAGYGTWGPPIRTGNHPEIVEITINFSN